MNSELKELSFFSNYIKRVFFLYGNTNDEFCTNTLEKLRIEEMLFRHLKELEYENIIFYSPSQKIYFLDQLSKNLCKPNITGENNSIEPSPNRSKLKGGRNGFIKLKTEKIVAQNPDNLTEKLNLGSLDDNRSVQIISNFIKKNLPKTAIVISNGLDLISHLEQTAIRKMSDIFTDLNGLPSENQNIIVLIFPNIELNKINELIQSHSEWSILSSFLPSGNKDKKINSFIHISTPKYDEVKNFLNHKRINNTLKFNFGNLDKYSISLMRFLASKDENFGEFNLLKDLALKLKNLNELNDISISKIIGNSNNLSALDELKNMTGLESISSYIEKQANYFESKIQKKESKPLIKNTVDRFLKLKPRVNSDCNLHLALKGRPGTGKTTIAEIIARVYYEKGLLETGQFIKVTETDLIAGHVGQTAIKTNAAISSAIGGVLFIDEAYNLAKEGGNKVFGQEAIDTIMEAMSSRQGEFAVIIAGYPEKLDNFISANDGIKRRFADGKNILTIPDYKPEILKEIFVNKIHKENLRLDKKLELLLDTFFDNWFNARDPVTFGNAGSAINLVQKLDAERTNRVKNLNENEKNIIKIEDFSIEEQMFFEIKETPTIEKTISLLDSFVGITEIKEKLKKKIDLIKFKKSKAITLNTKVEIEAGHYIFTGNSGTGKSEVAKRFGELMYSLNLLGKHKIKELKPTDILKAKEDVLKELSKGLNGVIFIDEAHQLLESTLGHSVITSIIPFMLDNKKNTSIIFAMYHNKLNDFLAVD